MEYIVGNRHNTKAKKSKDVNTEQNTQIIWHLHFNPLDLFLQFGNEFWTLCILGSCGLSVYFEGESAPLSFPYPPIMSTPLTLRWPWQQKDKFWAGTPLERWDTTSALPAHMLKMSCKGWEVQLCEIACTCVTVTSLKNWGSPSWRYPCQGCGHSLAGYTT